ncbi:hypothetical protein TUMSATVNIG1_59860 (plasmid) [Vibrio nigripulchritudo]|uniref:hypothetical protein n=1 Tax=Vibrio nigripulchritudo TaxID=28173 RepID=UPI00190D2ED5|nr:hypothetical protein [Vibrio nigripulchritudo]BCL74000.1 hypothetical protein VNTUMSATTG_59370 [Vibrio nigripulchritudo]BDU35377.1 hypothetical protein TUMSATVNIG1_59860 [Vibrio nigripulchritudo]
MNSSKICPVLRTILFRLYNAGMEGIPCPTKNSENKYDFSEAIGLLKFRKPVFEKLAKYCQQLGHFSKGESQRNQARCSIPLFHQQVQAASDRQLTHNDAQLLARYRLIVELIVHANQAAEDFKVINDGENVTNYHILGVIVTYVCIINEAL